MSLPPAILVLFHLFRARAGGGGCALTILSGEGMSKASLVEYMSAEGFRCYESSLGGDGVLWHGKTVPPELVEAAAAAAAAAAAVAAAAARELRQGGEPEPSDWVPRFWRAGKTRGWQSRRRRPPRSQSLLSCPLFWRALGVGPRGGSLVSGSLGGGVLSFERLAMRRNIRPQTMNSFEAFSGGRSSCVCVCSETSTVGALCLTFSPTYFTDVFGGGVIMHRYRDRLW